MSRAIPRAAAAFLLVGAPVVFADEPIMLHGRIFTPEEEARGTITIGENLIEVEHHALFGSTTITFRYEAVESLRVHRSLGRATILIDTNDGRGPIEIRTRWSEAERVREDLRHLLLETPTAPPVPPRSQR